MGGGFKIFSRLYKNFAKYFDCCRNVGKFLFFVIGVKKIAAKYFLRHLDGNWYGWNGFIRCILLWRINQHFKNNLRRNDNLWNYWIENFKLKKTIDKFKTCDKIS